MRHKEVISVLTEFSNDTEKQCIYVDSLNHAQYLILLSRPVLEYQVCRICPSLIFTQVTNQFHVFVLQF